MKLIDKKAIQRRVFPLTILSASLFSFTSSHATENTTAVNDAILTICPAGIVGPELQTRCNNLVESGSPDDVLLQVTSEQTAAQKSVALEMNSPQMNTLSNRISAFRSGKLSGGMTISGLMFDNSGRPLSGRQLAKLDSNGNKIAAGDEFSNRLGLFLNGHIGFGDRVTTAREAGYNFDNHGATIGADYRITDNFLLGTAFSYDNATSRYSNNLGDLEADNYSGAVYASFFTEEGFFIDGIFSGSHIDYSSRRHIEYSISENINTNAFGDNSGDAFNVSMNTGYNFHHGALSVTPLVRVDYTTNQVDALDERGGQGWALHVDEQDFDSLQTAAGLQLAYSVSLPWAVIVPMVQAEYIHEFKNDARNITTHYIQDPSQTRFNIRTDRPDRDYIIMRAGMSAQFIHGISAFVSYDTVQAHSYVGNHNFTGGVRMELSF